MFYLKKIDGTKEIDLSAYVISYDWSGDLDQAGRRLNFTIAYTKKDKLFTNAAVTIGDIVSFYYVDDSKQKKQQYNLFTGAVFMRSRNSESYTMEFVAYDRLIYLSRNKITKKFTDISIKSAIEQIANECGIKMGSVCSGLDKHINFIADNQSGTQAIQKALSFATATTGNRYHIYMKDDALQVVQCATLIDAYKITDVTNLKSCSHSESIENMVNKVIVVDKNGTVIGYAKNDDDINQYGQMQDIYKYDAKQDSATQAKAMLKRIDNNSRIAVLGNIQVIAGYSVEVDEEQLKGKFLIKADTHAIQNNKHEMTLQLAFTELIKDKATYTATGAVPATDTNVIAGTTSTAGTAASSTNIDTGINLYDGYHPSYGRVGCVEVVTKCGSYWSPFLANEANNGVADIDTLMTDARNANIEVVPFSESNLEPGDTVWWEDGNDGHVVIYTGGGSNGLGCFGNCSSVNNGTALRQDSLYDQFGGTPQYIIKTSHG